MHNICGIYKIVSPTNKLYIGQSVDIEKRFNGYKKLHCKNQTKLYHSFKKHGVENHKFEVITECEIEQLNELERYYQDLYSVIGTGLNCRLTESDDKSGEMSDETKLKIGLASKGRKHSDEAKLKMSLAKQNMLPETKLKISKARLGIEHSIKTKLKISLAKKGNQLSEETKLKMSIVKQTMSNETKLKMSVAKKKENLSEETIRKMSKSKKGNQNAKKIKN